MEKKFVHFESINEDRIHETESFPYMETGCVNVTREHFGNKAYSLERMYEEGMNVPKAVYLNSEFLDRIFIKEHQEEYEKLAGNLNIYNKNTGIRQWIAGQKKNTELTELCDEICRKFKGKVIAVRSSTNVEDGTDKSYAGAFETILDVTDAKGLYLAISQVYASKYNYLVDPSEDVTMGVIVQEQIQADYAGVVFTANPLTGEEEYIFNYTRGACENVVSGKEVKEIIFDKTEAEQIGELTEDLSAQLLRSVRKIENIFGEAMDIEWATRDGEVYILQARQITTIKKQVVTDQNFYVDSLSEKIMEEYDMSPVRRTHKKYMDKHYHVRKAALEAGLLFPEVGYLFYNQRTLSQEVFDKIVFDARIYKVVSDKEIRTLAKEDVVDYLKGSGEKEDGIVRLQQITFTDACGNTGMTEDGCIYIEFIPGGFGGFLSGELPFSTYIVDPEGKIQHKDEKIYSAKWEFDEKQRKFLRKDCSNFSYALSEKMILQIVSMAEKVQSIMPNARAEWEMEGEKVYLNDISFEENGIKREELLRNQISAGEMSGEIRIINDLEELKKILRGRSIVPESDFYEATRSDALRQYLERHNINSTKRYIFVSESAHPTLSLLLPYSNGFIFEKGGMLSHLAIILRENHIPGIVEENARNKYCEGEEYRG